MEGKWIASEHLPPGAGKAYKGFLRTTDGTLYPVSEGDDIRLFADGTVRVIPAAVQVKQSRWARFCAWVSAALRRN